MAKQTATVPLHVAEFLRVTLQIAKQSELLTTEQKQRIGMVLAMYEVQRDEWLLNLGYTAKQIGGMAKSAALALANHFDYSAQSVIEDGAILDMDDFERQFDDNKD